MEYIGCDDADPANATVIPMHGNGDFRSGECVTLIDECDIVVSNPPFTLAKQAYIPLLAKHRKKFLIIGDLNWISGASVFPMIARNEMWLGCGRVSEFIQPDGTTAVFGNKLWFTNLGHKKRHGRLELKERYSPEKHPAYLNYDAIDVRRVSEIPCDYDGLMGVPITFLYSYCPEQFEIIGCPKYMGEYGRDALGVRPLGKEWLDAYRAQGGTGNYTENMAVLAYFDADGTAKSPFARIIIRRR